jgi:hypothetical protein
MERRKFLGLSVSAGALAFMNAHSFIAQAACNSVESAGGHLIASLRLLTHASLTEMKKFYGETIGLKVVSTTDKELTIQAGLSTITFVKTTGGDRPFYHFAFNIPENKIQKAFDWQKKRTALVNPRPTNERNPMRELVHFPRWNAHSIFFIDPAGNLVEYIARHDLHNAAGGDFTANDILYASEIGLVVNDQKGEGEIIRQAFGLDWYTPATSDNFWVAGGIYGMLLMIRPDLIWTGPPGEENKTAVFETMIEINAKKKLYWKVKEYPYSIISK